MMAVRGHTVRQWPSSATLWDNGCHRWHWDNGCHRRHCETMAVTGDTVRQWLSRATLRQQPPEIDKGQHLEGFENVGHVSLQRNSLLTVLTITGEAWYQAVSVASDAWWVDDSRITMVPARLSCNHKTQSKSYRVFYNCSAFGLPNLAALQNILGGLRETSGLKYIIITISTHNASYPARWAPQSTVHT